MLPVILGGIASGILGGLFRRSQMKAERKAAEKAAELAFLRQNTLDMNRFNRDFRANKWNVLTQNRFENRRARQDFFRTQNLKRLDDTIQRGQMELGGDITRRRDILAAQLEKDMKDTDYARAVAAFRSYGGGRSAT